MIIMCVVSLAAVFQNYHDWEFVVLKFNAYVSCLCEACHLFTTVQDKTNKNFTM